jgi:hypothetical protein
MYEQQHQQATHHPNNHKQNLQVVSLRSDGG